MEKSTPLQYFMGLANFDQSLNDARHNITLLNSEITALNQELLRLQTIIESNKQELHNFQKSVHSHELAMKELDANLQKQKGLQDIVTNQKEYNAVKNSITQIKQEQHNYETILIDEWHKLDQAKLTFNSKQQELEAEIAKIKSLIPEKTARLEELKLEFAKQTEGRQAFLSHLPAEWLEKYEAMYTRVNNPIVQILGNACGACYQEATIQVINDLKHQKLTQCKGCFRFLFF